MLIYNIYRALSILLQLLSTAIFVYCITTWIAPRSRFRYLLERFIEPAVSPFRALNAKLVRRWGIPVDFSCFFAMIAIEILEVVIYRLLLIFI